MATWTEEFDSFAEGAESAARDPSTIFHQGQMYRALGRRPIGPQARNRHGAAD